MKDNLSLAGVVRGLAAAAVLAAAIGAGSACVASFGNGVYVAYAPPAPVYEARIVAPGPGFVWVAGFYRWDGRAYIWRPGRWERPPHPHARWEQGRWEQHGNHGWRYKEGHWR